MACRACFIVSVQTVCLSVVAPAHNVESAGTEKLAVVSELKPSLIQPFKTLTKVDKNEVQE